MVTDRLQNEESRRKSVEGVPFESDALVSEKQEDLCFIMIVFIKDLFSFICDLSCLRK